MGSLKYADSRNGLQGDAAAYLVNGEGQKSHSEVLSRKKKAAEDGEIDVFSADKYFNGGMIDSNDKKLGSRCCSITSTPDHLGVVKYKTTGEVMMIHDLSSSSRPQTPSSIYSESSLNSQSALIRRQSQRRTPSRNRIKTTNEDHNNNSKKNFLVNLACHCACLDKKSVDVHHHHMKDDKLVGFDHAATVPAKPQSRRHPQSSITVNSGAMMKTTSLIDTIDFIKMKSNTSSPKPKINGDHITTRPLSNSSPMMINLPSDHNQQSLQEEKPRKSLAVFGSPTKTGIKLTTKSTYNMEEPLINMLSWDAIPQPPADEIEIQGPKKSSTDDQTTIKDDDANESWCSEASSDLFEIKCISPRQIPMESSSCYAPSEASVEWSVVTASMADFSLVSDTDQNQCTGLSSHRNEAVSNNGKGSNKLSSSIMVQNDVQKRRLMSSSGGLLSGCTNQKSVRVAEDVLFKKTNKMGPADEGRRSSSSESVHMMMTKSYKPKMSRFQPSDDVPRSGKLGYRRSS